MKKMEFDLLFKGKKDFTAIIPVHLTTGKSYKIANAKNEPNEEYYKWQFIYSLIHSGMFNRDFIGSEVQFPKGNKESKPIKMDAAIFDSTDWFIKYKAWHENQDQTALDWLRKHLIAVIEFKNENSKNVETVYNVQLKPALKEVENDFAVGFLYDAEKLFLFKKINNYYLRFDDSLNVKGDESTTKDLSLDIPDGYYKIPSFEHIIKRIGNLQIDVAHRTIDDLEIITGSYSKQLSEGISNILKVMDSVSMKNQRGYEILIQTMALKIFDEKRNAEKKAKYLEFYETQEEKDKFDLLFYITNKEKNFVSLNDDTIQDFIGRMRKLYNEASEKYHYILKKMDSETIVWEKEEHIKIISSIVDQFQNYSFIKSEKSDLYQIVFFKFASEFSKADKGQFLTPLPIIDFLVQIINPRNYDRIIDPTSGIADFLSVSYVNSKSTLDDGNFYGCDNDENMIMLAQLNMLLNGDGNAVLKYKPNWGSITWKFDDRNELVNLIPSIHKNGNWDQWKDQTKLKKFDIVLTNPPFGEDRKIEANTAKDKELLEMYELWNISRCGNWIDPGIIFLENAYRILDTNGRIGIVLSNSIASIDRWEKTREWLLKNMRIVALFDLPSNIFADTGVNTTIIVAYKPDKKDLSKLQKLNYDVFTRKIEKIGYEVRTNKRVKYYNPIYKINDKTFDVEIDNDGNPVLDEEFTTIVREFRDWCKAQEQPLYDIFAK